MTRGNLVTIRRYEQTDAQSHFEAVKHSFKELKVWFSWCKDDYSLQDSIDFIVNPTFACNFAIITNADNRFVGGCGLNLDDFDKKIASMSYWIDSHQQGHGYMKEAAKLLKLYGFDRLKLETIYIDVAYINKASRTVAESVGCTPLKEYKIIKSYDGILYKGTRFSINALKWVKSISVLAI